VRQHERAIATPARAPARAPGPAGSRQALARELTDRAAATIHMPVDVRPRRDGYAIRVLVANLAAAESILARLAAPHDADR
jgi:hypothetical protein